MTRNASMFVTLHMLCGVGVWRAGMWLLALLSAAGLIVSPHLSLAHAGAVSAAALASQFRRRPQILAIAGGLTVALLTGCFAEAARTGVSAVVAPFLIPLATLIPLWAVAAAGVAAAGRAASGEETTRVDPAADARLGLPRLARALHFDFDSDCRGLVPLMAERLSTRALAETVVRWGLMPETQAAAEARRAKNAAHLCELLIEKGFLTHYQASCVCAGMAEMLMIGEYIVLDRIGRGGMAVVLRVRHRATGHEYAMKLFEQLTVGKRDLKQRFVREMEAVKELAHPNIAIAKDAGKTDGYLYIVMEYVEGRNLAQIVRERGPLPLSTALDFLRQAARALGHAHSRGLVHRDVKPGNLICAEGNRIKLVDLGLARFADELERCDDHADTSVHTQYGQLMGTIDYMAPEQARDMSSADARSDIYGLGCTFFFMLTGQPHLHGRNESRRARALVNDTGFRDLEEVRSGLPAAVYEVFRRMTARDPHQRYPSIAALLADLEVLSDRLGVPAADAARPVRVLLVEDSRTDSLYTLMHLEQTVQSFQATVVNCLAAAFDKLESEQFELVLLDLNLPDSGGVETVQRMRGHAPDIAIIVLTGDCDADLVVSSIAAGADDFLPKSALDVQTLERHILLTLSRRETSIRHRHWRPAVSATVDAARS